jgi:hypothetical protein
MSDDWQLSQGTVDFRNEERRAAQGTEAPRSSEIPPSNSITVRPVWRRRQRRAYLQSELAPPSEAEIQDAIRVLGDGESQVFAPALYLEAFRIFDEAG